MKWTPPSRSIVLSTIPAIGILLGAGLFFSPHLAGARWRAAPNPTASARRPPVDPARVAGQDQCLDCHRAEYRQWQLSPHANLAFDELRTVKLALDYAKNLGMDPGRTAHAQERCVQCHATTQVRQGELHVLHGVSCESCHNPSGGDSGWLNQHGFYGVAANGAAVTRDAETKEHLTERMNASRQAGLIATTTTYDLVRRCFECHIVYDEELVNRGKHPAFSKDFNVQKAIVDDKIRHNFHLDQQVNAEASSLWLKPAPAAPRANRAAVGRKRVLQIVGHLADAEITLLNIAAAKDREGQYFGDMIDRVEDARKELEDIVEAVEDQGGSLPSVKGLLADLEKVQEKAEDENMSLDDVHAAARDLAARIGPAGRKFAAEHDGSKLQGVEVD